MTSCCPPGSWASLKAEDGEFSGNVEKMDSGMNCYVVGPKDAAPDKAVLFVQDLYEYVSARNKGVAEQLASEGYMVFLPDLFRGDYFRGDLSDTNALGTWCKKFGWDVIGKEFKQTILPFIKSKGCKTLGMITFCYGGFIAANACSDPDTLSEFKVSVNCHSAIALHNYFFGGAPDCCDLAEKIRVPSIFLVAKNDPDFLKEGGALQKCVLSIPNVGAKCKFFDFPNQAHGWVNRGDVSDPEVKDGVRTAMNMALAAFREHLC
mmetsp:Transcript_372/g.1256  ORF Transcript_372/g.1256 Transcript_372/m.1256 type:complete len:263 (-) Transcript_372:1534-2322(-)|eukprot:CAMPEP_0198729240 /NCGR_PEP_ID=MMETSP1475-20131203/15965_1 /TAXON_ID= ORGANISM="Unidentified sp., Strain CCMP1999" /NCGR_SAMPLE_ID=MMETSP1475 /ASSEMBLY_ACC=CAM_ASM_001111 /LENGTH=262 /DNA_ID=CAMNT_0044491829 /DNA_START=117 /DNA_END=905 /DNA_ORIENTATION=-